MAADIRIARKDAGKIGLPEVALGVLPGTGGTQRLARLVGKARAIELMATGRLLTMDEAHELGIVTDVWGEPELKKRSFADAVIDYAQQFTPPNKASRAVGRMKRAVTRATNGSSRLSTTTAAAAAPDVTPKRSWRTGKRKARSTEMKKHLFINTNARRRRR